MTNPTRFSPVSTGGIRSRNVTSTWSYHSALNFYQIAKPTSIQMIDEKYDPDTTQVYVVDTQF